MPQKHDVQHGMFHVTTCTQDNIPWCTWSGIPENIISNLFKTRDLAQARVYGFCLISNHVHLVVSPGERGLSSFMQSFKSNATKDVRSFLQQYLHPSPRRGVSAAVNVDQRQPKPWVSAVGNIDDVRNIGWQKSYYDERIRTSRQYTAAMNYVIRNAAKHRLVDRAEDWPWTSLHYQDKLDPMEIWTY